MTDTPFGIPVMIRSQLKLLVAVGGALLEGRFLFLPATLCVRDRVWLRIERLVDDPSDPKRGAIDVAARVTHVLNDSGATVMPVKPGERFCVSIDRVDVAALIEAPSEHWEFDDDAEADPTDPTMSVVVTRTTRDVVSDQPASLL